MIEYYKLDQYIPFSRRIIDLMILTHPDPDHLNGLVEVLKRYKVRRVFYNGVEDKESAYVEFLKEIEKKKIIIFLSKKKVKNTFFFFFNCTF